MITIWTLLPSLFLDFPRSRVQTHPDFQPRVAIRAAADRLDAAGRRREAAALGSGRRQGECCACPCLFACGRCAFQRRGHRSKSGQFAARQVGVSRRGSGALAEHRAREAGSDGRGRRGAGAPQAAAGQTRRAHAAAAAGLVAGSLLQHAGRTPPGGSTRRQRRAVPRVVAGAPAHTEPASDQPVSRAPTAVGGRTIYEYACVLVHVLVCMS